ncbi:hypothetical protein AOLI_G00322280 [Acnodon oligacanthus]
MNLELPNPHRSATRHMFGRIQNPIVLSPSEISGTGIRGSSDSGVFGLAAGEPRPGPCGCPERSGPIGWAPPSGHAGSWSPRHCAHSGRTQPRIESGLFSRPSGNARNVELRFLSEKKVPFLAVLDLSHTGERSGGMRLRLGTQGTFCSPNSLLI